MKQLIRPTPPHFHLAQLHFAARLRLRHKNRLIIRPYPQPSPGCSFRPRSSAGGGCHCDPSPPGKRRTPAAVPPPRCGLPQPPSAAASDLVESLCPRNLANGLGLLKGPGIVSAHCSRHFKTVLIEFLLGDYSTIVFPVSCCNMSSASTPSETISNTHSLLRTSAILREENRQSKSQAAAHC